MSINIHKVHALPEILEPSSIYFVKPLLSATFDLYVTNASGTTAVLLDEGLSMMDVVNYITSIRNQPDGIAGVDSNSLISTSIGIDGQNMPILGPNAEYLWKDNVSVFVEKAYGGGGNPTFGVYMGNFQGLLFSSSNMQQVWCDYHILHDYALGTKQYPHVHWLPITNQAGVVRWGFEYMAAKGHQQQIFTNPVTVYVEQAVTANSLGMHMVAEVSEVDAIPATNLEPDAFVKIRVFRDAAHANDTYPAQVHAWCCDLHYQIARIGTINKAPNFYSNP